MTTKEEVFKAIDDLIEGESKEDKAANVIAKAVVGQLYSLAESFAVLAKAASDNHAENNIKL